MLYLLKRHPFPVAAHFRHSLVLTYALPAAVLEPLLAPGLTLDRYGEYGFVAIALVQTERLRPACLPAAFGQSFFLAGYRIFARYQTREGRNLRGLRILRSETDSWLIAFFGNLLTHYRYHRVTVTQCETPNEIEIQIHEGAKKRLHLVAELGVSPAPLPAGSPFPDLKTARRYAGPLPFTFDYEPETHSIIRVQGVRSHWEPMPIRVTICENAFLQEPPFAEHTPILASAFHVADIPYRWERGIREALPGKREAV